MVFGRLVNKGSSRSRRRWVVSGFYISLALFAGLVFAADSESYFIVGTASLLVSVFILHTLRSSIQKVTDDFAEGLDERQQMVRDRAHRRAYQILGMVLVLVFIYLSLALREYKEAQLWLPNSDDLNLLGVFVLYLVIGLPTTIVAWTEPDPEE